MAPALAKHLLERMDEQCDARQLAPCGRYRRHHLRRWVEILGTETVSVVCDKRLVDRPLDRMDGFDPRDVCLARSGGVLIALPSEPHPVAVRVLQKIAQAAVTLHEL